MTTDRFHKAAKDGLLEVLREATRKECNNKDESGMTPTLWAAFEGHVEALRLLCGRGGEPDKADYFGNTALHLASARGHKECVTFLVNFGANVYTMDVDGHTAQELAAINGRDDILRFLDQATAKLENNDKKKAKSMKEKAKKDHEKSHKQYQKRQSKAEIMAEKELKKLAKEWDQGYNEDVSTMPHRPSTVLMALKQKMTRSSSQGNLLADEQPRPTYSALVGTVNSGARGRGAVYKKALASKMKNGTVGRAGPTDDFKVGEVEHGGRRSVTSLSGVRRDSEVMYVGTFGAGPQARGELNNVFKQQAPAERQPLTRSLSQPDFTAAQGEDSGIGQEVLLQEPASIFDRPGFGSVAFRRSITATLGALPAGGAPGEDMSIGSAGSLAARHAYQPAEWNSAQSESSTITSDEEGEAEDSGYASLERFLTAWGLAQYVQKFKDEQIDLDALMLLTESDMKSLGLPLGPYRKLVTAVQERKQALSNPGVIVDSAI
ncbi:pre-mRNA splicing regulator USH1G [Cydia fagiglandana]|uniref:pre-mRNA splicing regulator USH1G n=1 Tax=Cydia fagiglandana TaxID=1458189 RepID=UPI002FEE4A5E